MKFSTRSRRRICTTLALAMLFSCLPPSSYLTAKGSAATPATRGSSPGAKTSAPAGAPTKTQPTKAQARQAYAQLPLSFEPNRGQVDRSVLFTARGGGYTTFLTATEAKDYGLVDRVLSSRKKTLATAGSS